MRGLAKYLLVTVLLLCGAGFTASAQFKSEAFSQSYNDDQNDPDSVDVMFSFKNYFRGIAHKEDVKIGVVFAGSTIFIGGEQIYNRQYWKLPLIYGGLAASVGAGFYFRDRYQKSLLTTENPTYQTLSTACFIGAGLGYWATHMDGMYNFNKDVPFQAGKATIYSLLLPGLGQAYNGEYWKIPVYYGIMIGGLHFYKLNVKNYERFRRIYNEATDPEVAYEGAISAETALYYRNYYRRMRDYSILVIGLGYLLQAIDANVFAYMHDFEVNDDMFVSVSPTLLSPEPVYALGASPRPGVGVSFGLTF